MAPIVDKSTHVNSGNNSGGFRLVALRCDSLRRAGRQSTRLGERDVYSRRADVRENRAYAHKVRKALEKGVSPGDFPREDYEANWEGRFTLEDLNVHGKRALGMDV